MARSRGGAYGARVRRGSPGSTGDVPPPGGKVVPVLFTVITVLALLWLLGVLTTYTLGGFIHVLLVVALIVVVLRILRSPRTA